MVFRSLNEEDTEKAGERFAEGIKRGDVVALYGEIGAGKTAFVRGMAKGLGIKDRVTSPTYAIVNEYIGDTPFYHFDMYRILSEDELFDIGWDDYISGSGIIAAEWAENVDKALPEETIKVFISKSSEAESERVIRIEFPKLNREDGLL